MEKTHELTVITRIKETRTFESKTEADEYKPGQTNHGEIAETHIDLENYAIVGVDGVPVDTDEAIEAIFAILPEDRLPSICYDKIMAADPEYLAEVFLPNAQASDLENALLEHDYFVATDEQNAIEQITDNRPLIAVFDRSAGNAYAQECCDLIQQYADREGWDALCRVIEHLDPMKVIPDRPLIEQYEKATEGLLDKAKAEIRRQVKHLGGYVEIDEAVHGSYDEPFDGKYTPETVWLGPDGRLYLECGTEFSRGYKYDVEEFLNVLELCYLADYLAAIQTT